MYACFIDASKAFDRVNHWFLFDKLLNRGVPIMLVRILMTWYTTQTFVVKWDNVISSTFHVSNGVRQGGVLSPILFNIFIDDLSERLIESKIGCHFNGICYNHLNYADDCVLLAPSSQALQALINVCNAFAKNNDMIYNCKKSMCMTFNPKRLAKFDNPTVYLGDHALKWVEEFKYLGVSITHDLSDGRDMERQRRYFYARGNMLIRQFKNCTANVKAQLFKTYCSNMYCGHLWNKYTAQCFKKVKVAYNNIFRSLMGLKRDCSISHEFVTNNVHGFDSIVRNYINGFRKRIVASPNLLVNKIANSLYFIYSSKLLAKWVELTYLF